MEEIAQVYARSLFEVASEQDKLDTIKRAARPVRRRAAREPRPGRLLLLAVLLDARRRRTACTARSTGADPAFMNFLEALIERHRMPAIFRIRTDFEVLWDKTNKLLPVQVTSAIELDAETRREPRPADRRADRQRDRADRARSTRRSSAASCCASATSSWTRRSGPASNNFAGKSRRLSRAYPIDPSLTAPRQGASRTCRSSQTRSPQSSRAGSRASTRPAPTSPRSGTVLSVADGIAPRPRPRELHVVRDARAAARRHRPGAQPRVRQRRRRAVRRVGEDRRGRHRQAHRAPARDPGRRRAARPDRRPARQPARRQGPDPHDRDAARSSTRLPASSSASRSRSRCRPASRRSTR